MLFVVAFKDAIEDYVKDGTILSVRQFRANYLKLVGEALKPYMPISREKP
jgi:hypothetical protein